jgi:hypothetical protein
LSAAQVLGVVGTSLQLSGAVVAFTGFLYAWNRASHRFSSWIDSVKSTLNQLRSKITRATSDVSAELKIGVELSAGATVNHPGTPEERLSRIENTLSELPGKLNEATENAIGDAISQFDSEQKAFAVKDLYWALGGLAIQVIGYVMSLFGLLCN